MVEEHYKLGICKMKKIFFILFATVLLIQTASAFTFINVYVDETGEAIFLGETDENPELPLGIKITGGEITGFTSAVTNKQGELWTISYSLSNSEINLILPKGAVIKELSNGEISLVGDRISIYFQDQIEVQYTIERIEGPLIPSANIPLLLIFLLVLIILIAYLINYTKREKREHEEIRKELKKTKRSTEKKKDRLELIKQVLSDRERLIIDKIKETGKIKSSYLRKMTDIPKASFSRHVQELEKKGLIKRSGEGKNKFIELIRE